jgi:hypothetical protein
MELGNQQERLREDLHWLAGMWEAEGWFSMQKGFRTKERSSLVLNCGMANTDMEIIDTVIKILSKNNIAYWIGKPRKNGLGKKLKRDIVIQGLKRVERFLSVLLPYLRTKRQKALLLKDFIEFRKTVPSKYPYGDFENSIYLSLKSLNNRSSVESSTSIRLNSPLTI